jgi:hypothetical protein
MRSVITHSWSTEHVRSHRVLWVAQMVSLAESGIDGGMSGRISSRRSRAFAFDPRSK